MALLEDMLCGQSPAFRRNRKRTLPWIALDKECLEQGLIIPVDGVTGKPFDSVVRTSMDCPLNDVVTVTLTVHARIRDHRSEA